jgi:voltage-gated potassium channel
MDSVESDRKAKMNVVKSLLRNRHVQKVLSSEIYEFFEYLLSCNNSSIDEYSILSELPQSLRSRLNIAINRQIIKSIPIFCQCSDHAMALLIEQLYQLVILPGEYVMEQGMPGNEMYFVVRGKLQVLRDTKQGHRITMAKRSEGEFFGEIALIMNVPRTATVTATHLTRTARIPRDVFERMMGKLGDILSRQMDLYAKYEEQYVNKRRML